MKIQVLGPGCASCEGLMNDVKALVSELSIECELEKVTDISRITSLGVMLTPALIVDGEVKVAGRRPTADELRDMIR